MRKTLLVFLKRSQVSILHIKVFDSPVKNLVRVLLISEGHYFSCQEAIYMSLHVHGYISNLEHKLLIGRGVKLAF